MQALHGIKPVKIRSFRKSCREEDFPWSCDPLNDIKDNLHLLLPNLPWTTLLHVSTVNSI
jgi:hypothetical protein